MKRTLLVVLVGVAACGACAGCGGAYRAETVLHPDGSIDRAVYQMDAETPDAAKDPKLWKQVTFAEKPEDLDRKGWPEALPLLPAHAKDDQHPYFVAWNHFASVKDVPETVVFGKEPEGSGLPEGKLERELTKTDLGFVEEFDWDETLNDVVSLPDLRKNREELEDLMIRFGQDVFPEAVGKEYDPADLVQWAKTDGKDWLNELTDIIFSECAAHKGRELDKPLTAAFVASCERRGLKLSKEGKLFANPDNQKAFQDFAVALVGRKVKKDGKPVGPEQVQKWLDELNAKDNAFQKAGEKVVAQKYGGEKAFGDRVGKLLLPVVGLYLIGPPWDFHYAMTFPGPVVKTNGELLGAGDRVLWQFRASDAFPLGYTMSADSLFVPEDARKLLGRDKPLSDRDGVAAYADLVRNDDLMLQAVRQCRADRSLDPLYEFINAQKKAGNSGAAARMEKVLKLLKA